MKSFIKLILDFFIYFFMKPNKKNILVFLENNNDIIYFDKFFLDLFNIKKKKIIIIYSELNHNLTFKKLNYVKKTIYVGNGLYRQIFFRLMKTKVLFMTTPDLENFELKKSVYPITYIYLFHSIVSTHMIYNNGAFDHFDYIFSVGSYQDTEIRESEKIKQLSPKKIIPFGYPRILDLKNAFKTLPLDKKKVSKNKSILIAPSWGPSSITDICIIKIFDHLKKSKYKIIYRPHPMSVKKKPNFFKKLEAKYNNEIIFEYDISKMSSIHNADYMISDWSGVAIEFYITTGRPIIFIDTPPKINNEIFQKFKSIPLEKSIRSKIGIIIKVSEINNLSEFIFKLKNKSDFNVEYEHLYDYEANLNTTLDKLEELTEDYQ